MTILKMLTKKSVLFGFHNKEQFNNYKLSPKGTQTFFERDVLKMDF